MGKRFLFTGSMLIASFFFMVTYSFSQYEAEEDNEPQCCCKVWDGETSVAAQQDVFDYEFMSKDACIAQKDTCVADRYCKE